MTQSVHERYRALRREIDEELQRCGREPASVTLVGIAKRQSAASIVAAIEAGLTRYR